MLLERLIHNLTGLIETKIELVKLEAKEEVTFIVVRMLYTMTIILVLAVFLIAFSLGIAMLFNEWLHSRFWGFFIVAFIFGTKAAVLIYYRKNKSLLGNMKKYVADLIAKE
jgi:uncharacterized membrane protein YqjE